MKNNFKKSSIRKFLNEAHSMSPEMYKLDVYRDYEYEEPDDDLRLDFDMQKRRLSLGMKQVTKNPWDEINKLLDVNKIHEGEITNITEFGIFVKINEDIDGLIHINDLSWDGKVEEELKEIMAKVEKSTKQINEEMLKNNSGIMSRLFKKEKDVLDQLKIIDIDKKRRA